MACRRRLLCLCLGAAPLACGAGCYHKVIRDDRLSGEPVIHEPDHTPDFLDEAEAAERQREKRDAKMRRDRERSGG